MMIEMIKRILLLSTLVLLAASVANADEITLNGGKVVVGKIRSQKDGLIEIQDESGKISYINILKIKGIKRGAIKIKKPKENNPADLNDRYGVKLARLELMIEELKSSTSKSSDNTQAEAIEALRSDLNTIQADMAEGSHVFDRMDALEKRIDDIAVTQGTTFQKLRNDLTQNSDELLKVIVSVSELQEKVDAYQRTAPEANPDFGQHEITGLLKSIQEMKKNIANSSQLVEDVRSLKKSNTKLAQEIQDLAENRVKALERSDKKRTEDYASSMQRIADLEEQNNALSKRMSALATKGNAPVVVSNGEDVSGLREEMKRLRRQMSQIKSNSGSATASGFQSPGSSIDPMLVYLPADSERKLFAWDSNPGRTLGVAGAEESSDVENRVTAYNEDDCQKWFNIARSVQELGDTVYTKAIDKPAESKKADREIIQKLENAKVLFATALTEYSYVFDSNQSPDCIQNILELQEKLDACDSRIAYLKRKR